MYGRVCGVYGCVRVSCGECEYMVTGMGECVNLWVDLLRGNVCLCEFIEMHVRVCGCGLAESGSAD